jgi:hypothetical protein
MASKISSTVACKEPNAGSFSMPPLCRVWGSPPHKALCLRLPHSLGCKGRPTPLIWGHRLGITPVLLGPWEVIFWAINQRTSRVQATSVLATYKANQEDLSNIPFLILDKCQGSRGQAANHMRGPMLGDEAATLFTRFLWDNPHPHPHVSHRSLVLCPSGKQQMMRRLRMVRCPCVPLLEGSYGLDLMVPT